MSPEKARKPRERSAPAEFIPHHGFHITVNNQDDIFAAMQNGVSGILGKQYLEQPITDIEVSAISDLETFDFLAEIDPEYSIGEGRHKGFNELISNELFEGYEDIRERGEMYLMKTPSGTELLISRQRGLSGSIHITTGFKEGDYGEDNEHLIPSPRLDPELFPTVLADFNDFVTRCVNRYYEINIKSSPNVELQLGIPRKGKEARGRSSSLPEELVGKIEVEVPHITFDDIGGQHEAKEEIEGLAFALKRPDLYKKWGTKPPKGVLLHGPPGTGKTLLAKALAAQSNARFLHVQASDVASKWYGESEKLVESIFAYAGNGPNSIIYLDEIDALAPHITTAHEATRRVVATLLENMDGLVSSQGVFVVASTNRIDSLEPALKRAGRFDRWVEVTLPNAEDRIQIFGIHMEKAQKIANRRLFHEEIDFTQLSHKFDGRNGADIAEVLRRALERKVRLEGISGDEQDVLKTEDIMAEINRYEKK